MSPGLGSQFDIRTSRVIELSIVAISGPMGGLFPSDIRHLGELTSRPAQRT